MRRVFRGDAALALVMAVAVLSAAALASHYAGEIAARDRAVDRQAGRVFAAWFMAVHRAAQQRDLTALLGDRQGLVLELRQLRDWNAVPPGLPDQAGPQSRLTLGIANDGNDVPMAFAVLEPSPDQSPEALRAGAIASDLGAVAMIGDPPGPMAVHVPMLEAVLNRQLAGDGLYVTADLGVRYRENLLYRRAQPGRPWLNRMDTALDAGLRQIDQVERLDAQEMQIDGPGQIGGPAVIDGGVSATDLAAARLTSTRLDAGRMTVNTGLRADRAATETLAAELLGVADRLQGNRLLSAGEVHAPNLTAGQGIMASGAVTTSDLDSRLIEIRERIATASIAAEAAFAPDGTISGRLATGPCKGC